MDRYRKIFTEMSNKQKLDLEKEFRYLNRKVFNGNIIKVPQLKWKQLKNKVGHIKWRRNEDEGTNTIIELALTTFYNLPVETLRNILIHEMIHVYLVQEFENDPSKITGKNSHGEVFTKMMNDINKKFTEYNIQPTEDVDDYDVEETSVRKKKYYFVIMKKQDGQRIFVFKKLISIDLDREMDSIQRSISFNKAIEKVEYGQSDELFLQKKLVSRDMRTAIKYQKVDFLTDKEYKELQKDIVGSFTPK